MKRLAATVIAATLIAIFPFLGSALAAPSAYDLFKSPTHAFVTMSPDGENLAFTYLETKDYCLDIYGRAKKEGTKCREEKREYRTSYQLAIFNIEESRVLNVIPLPEDFYTNWIAWANNDRLLVSLTLRTTSNTSGSRVSVGGARIISVPKDKGKFLSLLEDAKFVSRSDATIGDVTNFLRNDPDHVIIPANKGKDLDLWKVNVNDGSFERVGKGARGTFLWYTDHNGKPLLRFDISRYGKHFVMHSWSDEEQKWVKARQFRARRRGQSVLDLEFIPLASTGKPNQLYVISDEEDGTHRAVKVYDFKEDKFLETIFEHEKYDVSGAILNAKTGEFSGAAYYADRFVAVYEDKTRQKHFNALNKFFDNSSNVEILGFVNNDERAIILRTAPDIPGEYYDYDIKNANIKPLFFRRPGLAGITLGEAEVTTINTRDGQQITAYITHPSGGKKSNAPLIVMPHGGPEARDFFDYNPRVQFLATRGYRVLQVNFRGSSGYGRQFAKAGYGEWGGVMQNDVTDAVRQMHEDGYATPDTTCIVGYSYGGYVALYGAATTPELYKCVVSGGGVSDLILSMQETKKDFGGDSSVYEYWTRSIGDPATNKEALINTSPANLAARIKAPVLLMHGEDDTIVYAKHSKKMETALKKVGADVEYIKLEHEGHRNWRLRTDILYQEKLEEFLAEHLK